MVAMSRWLVERELNVNASQDIRTTSEDDRKNDCKNEQLLKRVKQAP